MFRHVHRALGRRLGAAYRLRNAHASQRALFASTRSMRFSVSPPPPPPPPEDGGKKPEAPAKERGRGGGGSGGGDEEQVPWFRIALAGGALLLLMSDFSAGTNGQLISLMHFVEHVVPNGTVSRVEVDAAQQVAKVILHGNKEASFHFTIPSAQVLETELQKFGANAPPVRYESQSVNVRDMLLSAAPSILLIGALLYGLVGVAGGRGSPFAIGKTAARIAPEDVTVRFKDVAGLGEAKKEVTEFVEFLRRPAKYRRLGARIPRGALLVGPPGTGKTLLAKATAGEAQVPFFSMAGSDFTEMFVGVGSSRVRSLFKQAREAAPCIIFLDEIDAVGRARSSSGMMSNQERENTLNQLLVELDGFDSTTGVVVLAGTNRVDILDKALLRPGRFDRTVNVDLPDIKGRKQIFDIHLRDIAYKGNRSVLAENLSALTPGFSGADVANVCNEAALIAARADADTVVLKHFEDGIERVVAGLAKQHRVLSEAERRTVAYHEAGHAITGWFLEHCDPLLKVSIVPRGSAALGYAMYQPQERAVMNKAQLLDRMCMTLGGRAAEEIIFGRISTGASDDLDRVTKQAYAQVVSMGMSDKVGVLAWPQPDPSDPFSEQPYSERMSEIIDSEVRLLVATAYERTRALLTSKKELLEALGARLLSAEMLSTDDLVEVLGKRPFAERRTYQEIVKESEKRQNTAPSDNNTPPVTNDSELNFDEPAAAQK